MIMKEKLAKGKEFILKLSKKTKVLIGVGAVVLIAAAVILALVLNRKDYEVLYSDVNTDEAQQIIGLLQETAIDYRYDGQGTIYVPEQNVDQVKANLASQGYPKSGFTYDIFTNNATMMTTDSDKQTYKLYELQNRIGATISLFDNVKDAKVTIALGEQQKYALDDSKQEEASASVVMIMKDNGSPTEEQAVAVQNLVSKAIPGMTIENVAIFDGNGKDVSVDPEDQSSSKLTNEDTREIARMVEDQVSEKVMNVLVPIFGDENVRVSAKASVNMETLIRESISYTTPDKIDANDKTGLLSNDSGSRESNGEDATAEGVPGTETNADIPEYNTDENENGTRYSNYQYDREYLFNQLKEQGEVPAGAIENLSVGVTVNGEDLGDIDEYTLISLIGNAAGIDLADQDEKITVLAAPFYDPNAEEETQSTSGSGFFAKRSNWIIIGIIVAVLLIAGIILAVILLRRKKKAKEKAALEQAQAEAEQAELSSLLENLGEGEEAKEAPEGAAVLASEEETEEDGPILDPQTEKSMELRQQIRDFAEQSPEIAAQMLRNWLNGGEADGGRNS